MCLGGVRGDKTSSRDSPWYQLLLVTLSLSSCPHQFAWMINPDLSKCLLGLSRASTLLVNQKSLPSSSLGGFKKTLPLYDSHVSFHHSRILLLLQRFLKGAFVACFS